MRIADKMALQQVQASLTKNRGDMNLLQEQSATQHRINRPSDDPLGATRVLGAKTDEKLQKQFIKSLNFARDFLNYTDQSLGEVSEILNRAKELALNQANEAFSNTETRRVVATEVEQLLLQSKQVANRKLGDRYIFAGYRTNRSPFGKDGSYRGDDGEIKIQFNKDAFISMNIPGNRVFLGEKNLGVDQDSMSVPRSAEQLDEYKIQEEQERELKANDVPLSRVFRANASGRGVSSIGEPQNEEETPTAAHEQGINVFGVLEDLLISLKTDSKAGIQESLDQLDLAFNQVTNVRSEVGARAMILNNTVEPLQKGIVDSKSRASEMEDVEVFQLLSDINRADTALKASLETSGRLIQPSLLDFLK